VEKKKYASYSGFHFYMMNFHWQHREFVAVYACTNWERCCSIQEKMCII